MGDKINNPQNDNQNNILSELSDIKQTLATSTEATSNMKESITEIKADIKEIKNRYITIDQHKEVLECERGIKADVENLKSFRDTLQGKMWGIGMLAGVITSVVSLIIEYFLRRSLNAEVHSCGFSSLI